MRILHLDPDDIDNPLSGGGPIRTFEINSRLARRHEITVITPTFEKSTTECVRQGIRYIRVGRKLGDHGSSHHLTFLANLPNVVRRFDYDLLVEDMMPPAAATWTPWFAKRSAPLIASVQWWMADLYTKKLKLPFHWGQRYGIRWYRHLIVLTEQMRRSIEKSHPRANYAVIPNGVSDQLFDQPMLCGGVMGLGVLYVGRIEMHVKGLDLLLQAFSMLSPERRPVLTIAGSGSSQDQAAFDAQVTRLGLDPWIVRLGKVSAEHRNRLLQACRFVVMPSRVETFGMTIAEANAAGKVALIFDAWPMNEVGAPRTPRVTPFDARAYARAIDFLMDMPDASLSELGEECRRWARRFIWDEVASAQEAFYHRAVELHAQRRASSGPR